MVGNPFQRVYMPLYAAKSHRFAFEFFISPYLSLHMPCKLERNLENECATPLKNPPNPRGGWVAGVLLQITVHDQ